jgi:hypothetical protein
MAHHLDYVELTWGISMGLSAFRILSQFAIKMIAIFAKKEISERAFEVLRISWTQRAISSLRDREDRSSGRQASRQGELRGPEPTNCPQCRGTGRAETRRRLDDP